MYFIGFFTGSCFFVCIFPLSTHVPPQAKYYRMLFDFDAKGDVELGCPKDTILVAGVLPPPIIGFPNNLLSLPHTGDQEHEEAEGWLQVATIVGDKRAGFIPSDYAEEISAEEAERAVSATLPSQAAAAAAAATQQDPSPAAQPAAAAPAVPAAAAAAAAATASSIGLSGISSEDELWRVETTKAAAAAAAAPAPAAATQVERPSEAGLQSFGLSSLNEDTSLSVPAAAPAAAVATQQMAAPMRVPSPSHMSAATVSDGGRASVAAPASSQTGGIVESFMKNEVYFRSLMKQRQETFMRLDACIADTASEISSCKAKNSVLAKKLRELDNMIEEDRAKWRSRIEEEKKLLTSQANTGMSVTTLTSSRTSVRHGY